MQSKVSSVTVKPMAILSQRTAKSLRRLMPEYNYARRWNSPARASRPCLAEWLAYS
jgi:hypothetical protein